MLKQFEDPGGALCYAEREARGLHAPCSLRLCFSMISVYAMIGSIESTEYIYIVLESYQLEI